MGEWMWSDADTNTDMDMDMDADMDADSGTDMKLDSEAHMLLESLTRTVDWDSEYNIRLTWHECPLRCQTGNNGQ